MSLLAILLYGIPSGFIAGPFNYEIDKKIKNPEKKFQEKVDDMTDFENDFVDESYLEKLVSKLELQSITIVSLSHYKDYQVEFLTSAPEATRATITTKKKFSSSLYVGQLISK